MTDIEKVEKIKSSIDKLKNLKNKFFFFMPETQSPNSSIYEIYFHAAVLKNIGCDVTIITEIEKYVPPTWVEKELTDHIFKFSGDKNLVVSPEDIMIIPETYSNVMEQTKNLPCLRVGLLQSFDYMLNALMPGIDWSIFGIKDIITVSTEIKKMVEIFQGKNKFNIYTYKIGIPEYFEKSELPQKPIVSIIGRNPNEISKFVKLFFSKSPHYNWITFDPMLTKSKPPQPMRRVDFAKRLKGNFAAVWIDRISSLGTFPLECMKSGVIPICLLPDIIPEYLIKRDENGSEIGIDSENTGFWTNSYYELVSILEQLLTRYLDDTIPNTFYENMENIAKLYNQESSEKEIIEIYKNIINNRIEFFENALNNN